MNTLFLNEHRCKCGKLLLKGVFFDGTAEIKCKTCGFINKIGNFKLKENCADYLLIINEKGDIVNVSDSACAILGYSSDELIGKHFTEINPTMPEDIGKKLFGSESVLDEDNYFKLDTSHKTKDGKILSIDTFLKLYKPNNKQRYVLLSAKLKNKENEEDNCSKTNHPGLVKCKCDFYFEIDKNGAGTYLSSSMQKLFGLSQEETIGKNYFDIVPSEVKEDAKNAFFYFSARELPYKRSNNVGIVVDGKSLYYDVYFTPNFNDSGKFIGYRVLGWLKNKA